MTEEERAERWHPNYQFLRQWVLMEHEGKCDAFGGAEFTRVLSEWEREGRPAAVKEFIELRANRPAPSH